LGGNILAEKNSLDQIRGQRRGKIHLKALLFNAFGYGVKPVLDGGDKGFANIGEDKLYVGMIHFSAWN
jgi:hypothetical protein